MSSGTELPVADLVPGFAQRLLHVGCGTGVLGQTLKAGRAVEVYGIETDPEAASVARARLDEVMELDPAVASLPVPEGFFDCILVDGTSPTRDAFVPMVRGLVPFLAPFGFVLAPVRNTGYWKIRTGLAPSPPLDRSAVVQAFEQAGLGVFGSHTMNDKTVVAQGFQPGKPLEFDGQSVPVESEQAFDDLATYGEVLVLVTSSYNPIAHARQLFDEGHPDWSYQVLSLIPQEYREDTDIDASLAAEMQLCLLSMDGQAATAERLSRFWTAQDMFYHATARFPTEPGPYQCQAEFWRRLGNPDMARSLLRSIHSVNPTDATANQLASLTTMPGPTKSVELPPAYDPAWKPRVLLITHPRPHYELDVLYDGLRTILGDDGVVEFPWKGTLHGQEPSEQRHYPCMFDWPGEPLEVDELIRQVETGRFDFILFGDIDRHIPQMLARRIAVAAGDTPIFILDTEDDPDNNRPALLAHLERETVAGYFKREMLTCVDYGPNAYPLPFAYPDGRAPEELSWTRPRGLFWAGNRFFGLRRLYLERIEATFGLKLDRSYDQDEYVEAVESSRIGLNLFGFGFDTVRYWELPAHGCMLLSHRLPIHIPQNFEDGKSAVFFDDLPDLEEKLRYYLERPDECAAIAQAGHAHFQQYHTGSARARQLLAWVLPRLSSAGTSPSLSQT